jgi:hypothetical protein
MRRVVQLLALLAVVGAGGWWNYQRNLAKEAAEPRPFRGYAEADLVSLSEAYETEIETSARRYAAAKSSAAPAAKGQLFGEQVKDFERASARGRAIRDAGGDLSEREAALADVRTELARRREDKTRVFLRRLLTF